MVHYYLRKGAPWGWHQRERSLLRLCSGQPVTAESSPLLTLRLARFRPVDLPGANGPSLWSADAVAPWPWWRPGRLDPSLYRRSKPPSHCCHADGQTYSLCMHPDPPQPQWSERSSPSASAMLTLHRAKALPTGVEMRAFALTATQEPSKILTRSGHAHTSQSAPARTDARRPRTCHDDARAPTEGWMRSRGQACAGRHARGSTRTGAVPRRLAKEIWDDAERAGELATAIEQDHVAAAGDTLVVPEGLPGRWSCSSTPWPCCGFCDAIVAMPGEAV